MTPGLPGGDDTAPKLDLRASGLLEAEEDAGSDVSITRPAKAAKKQRRRSDRRTADSTSKAVWSRLRGAEDDDETESQVSMLRHE